jgi:quercetin dioxygenase-like cupin family protein
MDSPDVKNIFIEDEQVPWKEIDPGVKRKIMAYNDHLMMVKVQFDKGGVGSLHHHPHSQISHVESGQFEIEINGNKKILTAGDAFYVPPNVMHGAVCLETGTLIDVFSPMREDFIEDKR